MVERLPTLTAIRQCALATLEVQRRAGIVTDRAAAMMGRQVWLAGVASAARGRRPAGGGTPQASLTENLTGPGLLTGDTLD